MNSRSHVGTDGRSIVGLNGSSIVESDIFPNVRMDGPANVGTDVFSGDHTNIATNVRPNVPSNVAANVYSDIKMRSPSAVMWGNPLSDSGHETSSDADDYLNANPWGANALFGHNGGGHVVPNTGGRYLPAAGPSNAYQPLAPPHDPLQLPYAQGNLAPSRPQSRTMANMPLLGRGGYRNGDVGGYLPSDANVYHPHAQPPHAIYTPQAIPVPPASLNQPPPSAPHPDHGVPIPPVGLNHSLPSAPHPGGAGPIS